MSRPREATLGELLHNTEPHRAVTQMCVRLNQGLGPDPILIDDALRALHPNTKPLVNRLANVAAFCAALRAHRFDQELPRIVELVSDLFSPQAVSEQQQVALQVIAACTQGQDTGLAACRPQLIELIVGNDHSAWRVSALSLLTRGGRVMEQGGAEIIVYLTALIEGAQIVMRPTSDETATESEEASIRRALLGSVVCLEGIVRYSFSSVPQVLLARMISAVCQLCQQGRGAFSSSVVQRSNSGEQNTRDLTLGDGCLDFLDALLRFGKVPPESLSEFVGTLCSIPNVEHSRHFDTKMSWHILKQVLSSGYGQRALQIMLNLLDSPAGTPPAVLRGAIFSVANASWGSDRVLLVSRMVSHASVIPSFAQALSCRHENITHEVALAVRRLVRRYGNTLQLEWEQLFQLLLQLRGTVHKDATEDLLLEMARLVLSLLEQDQFKGKVCSAISFVQSFSPFEEEEEEKFVLRLRFRQLSTFRKSWLDEVIHQAHQPHDRLKKMVCQVALMMEEYFVQESRAAVRLQLLQLLRQQMEQLSNRNSAQLLQVILVGLGSLHREEHQDVAMLGLEVVVKATQQPSNHQHFGALIDLLAAFVLTPSAWADGKQIALDGLFGMQPAHLQYHTGFTKHQQQLFVLLTGLLDSENLQVRQRVLQFLLGFHAGTHEQPTHSRFRLRQIPVVAWGVSGRPARHCALGVGSFIDTLIAMLVKESDWTILEQACRGVCRMLQHKQLIRSSHLPQITRLACGELGAIGGLGAGLDSDEYKKHEWLEGLAARVRCHVVGYTTMLEVPQQQQLCECLVSGMEIMLRREPCDLDDFAMRVLRVELDGLSHLALEQPLILSSQFKRITRSMFRAAQFPVLCGPLIELIHTVMHTTPSDATAEVVMLLADCIDTLGHAGSNLIHFGHQVLCLAMVKCPQQDRSHVLSLVTHKLRRSNSPPSLIDCTVDLLQRSTLAVSLFGPPPSAQHPDVFHSSEQLAVIIGHTIASVRVGSRGYALLTLRRVSGMTKWVIQLQNPVQSPSSLSLVAKGADLHWLRRASSPNRSEPKSSQPQPIPEPRFHDSLETAEFATSDRSRRSLDQLKVIAHSVSDNTPRAEMHTPQKIPHARAGTTTQPKPSSHLYGTLPEEHEEHHDVLSGRSSMAEESSTRTSLQTHSDGSWAKDTFDDLKQDVNETSPGVMLPPHACEWAARRSRRLPLSERRTDPRLLDPSKSSLMPSPWHLDALANDDDDGLLMSPSPHADDEALLQSLAESSPECDMPSPPNNAAQTPLLDARGVFQELRPLLMDEANSGMEPQTIQLWTEGEGQTPGAAALVRALQVLDQTPVQETMKVGLLYVGHGQTAERQILSNVCGSALYVNFIKSIGQFAALEDCTTTEDFTGGLDCSLDGDDGQYAIKWENEVTMMIFHCATLIGKTHEPVTDEVLLTRKRHIGNDSVHVVFSDNSAGYDMETITGSFNFVSIIVYPLDAEGEYYRVEVKAKSGIKYFGPVVPSSSKVVSKSALANFVRMSIIHATVATLPHTLGNEQHLSNKEIRLHQIEQIRDRFQQRTQ